MGAVESLQGEESEVNAFLESYISIIVLPTAPCIMRQGVTATDVADGMSCDLCYMAIHLVP